MAAGTYIGKLIDNRYQINSRVGSGGSARVYRAHDTLMGRTVALKILEEDETRYRINSRSFDTEVEAISKLSHPNIVTIYDVSMQGNVKYIVMEFVDGITLREYLSFHTHLVPEEVFSCAKQILSALEAAHAKGIIHRDIKPQNVMILKNGQVKVADFGIARLPDTDNFKLDDRAIGTVHYISPEQATGSAVDERSDLYSLGILMYEMLTGSRPFEASDASTVAMMQVSDQPAAPHTLRDDIPPALEQVIMRAMKKEPDERYENAAAMLRAIVRAEKHPTSTFKEAFSGKGSASESRFGGFFGRIFGHKRETAEDEKIIVDGTEEQIIEEESIEYTEENRTEEEDMNVILDRERYERKRRRWGKGDADEAVDISEIEEPDVPVDEPAEMTAPVEVAEDVQEPVEQFDEELEAEEAVAEAPETVEEPEDSLEETVEQIEEPIEEEIEESTEEEPEEAVEEIEVIDEIEEEPEEPIEEPEAVAEEEDDLDVPDFLKSRIEATVAKEAAQAEKALESEKAIDTADTVLFTVADEQTAADELFEEDEEELIESEELEEILEETEESEQEPLEDMLEEEQDEDLDEKQALISEKEAEADARFAEADARLAEAEERIAEADAKHAAVNDQLAEYELMCAELDARAAEADARDAELDKKQAIISAKEAEADARFAEADARLAEAEARVVEADARFAEAVAMREAEAQDRAVRTERADAADSRTLLLLKILFPAVSGALLVGLFFVLFYSGILLGRYVPNVDTYSGQSEIKGMDVVVEYVRDTSKAGTVLAQTPAAGFTRKNTDTIYLRVSAGKSVYEKYKAQLDEHLKGDLSSALAFLDFINSKEHNPQNRAVVIYEPDSEAKAGEVFKYEIDPVMDQKGVTTIRLYVSTGADE